eukprot:2968132-Prymnesium_polylepis.1
MARRPADEYCSPARITYNITRLRIACLHFSPHGPRVGKRISLPFFGRVHSQAAKKKACVYLVGPPDSRG